MGRERDESKPAAVLETSANEGSRGPRGMSWTKRSVAIDGPAVIGKGVAALRTSGGNRRRGATWLAMTAKALKRRTKKAPSVVLRQRRIESGNRVDAGTGKAAVLSITSRFTR